MGSPLFHHRHYVEIARILRKLDASPTLVSHFASELAGSNPNFDARRFTAAARGEPINGRDTR